MVYVRIVCLMLLIILWLALAVSYSTGNYGASEDKISRILVIIICASQAYLDLYYLVMEWSTWKHS